MKPTTGKGTCRVESTNCRTVLCGGAGLLLARYQWLGLCRKTALSFFCLLALTIGECQVVINEIGIAPSTGNGTGGEFIELFNRSACAVDLGCYTIVFSSTSGGNNASGWTLKIPSGYSIPSCGYFLIGGVSGQAGISGTGYPTGGTVNPYVGTANLDIGTITITANAVYMLQSLNAGTFPDVGGQLTVVNSLGVVVSSVAYGSGNNSNSYPLSAYTSCDATNNTKGVDNVSDPGNALFNVAGPFSSGGNQGIYLNATGTYQATNSLTPGLPNPSQVSCASPISFTSVSSNSPLCEGAQLNLKATAAGGRGALSYRWTGPNGFSSPLQNPMINNTTTAAEGSFTVKATDADGCSKSENISITINPLPGLKTIYHN